MSGVEASARGVGYVAGSAPAWESGWNVLSGGGVTAGKYSIAKITDGTSDGSTGTAPSSYLMYDSARTDGYMIAGVAVQGVRAFDPGTQQWTAPDAYKGNVDDPMSQRPYMWNDNNPVSYSDPSGYEAVMPGVAGAEAGGAICGPVCAAALGLTAAGAAALWDYMTHHDTHGKVPHPRSRSRFACA